MESFESIVQIVNSFHEQGETIAAAEFVIDEFNFRHENFKAFELREKAQPNFILMTTEGVFGKAQIIKIPENTFEFELKLMLNLLIHEMVHVEQKATATQVLDKNEREWQAYYEMIFHKKYPQIPNAKLFNKMAFAKKGLEYYERMEKDGALQKKYQEQKIEVENWLNSLSK